MPEELFEIESGIFSLSDQEPGLEEELVLAVVPFMGIPLDEKGMSAYVCSLLAIGDKAEQARLYEIGIKSVIGLYEVPLVTLEFEDRVKDMAQLQGRFNRGTYGRGASTLADSYIVSLGEKELRPDSNFPHKLAAFLARFGVKDINLIGKCDQEVMDYLSRLPSVTIGGIETKLRFTPDKNNMMTPETNPLGYAKETPLLLK
ncbi:MAG: hypothetical protein U9O94_02845 [Nanoarchaeota archaeon]|nr:hypothetical protein [Nanoarchaeota archaeon]